PSRTRRADVPHGVRHGVENPVAASHSAECRRPGVPFCRLVLPPRSTRTLTAATAEATTEDPHGYSARHLSVLEGLEAVRKRPGMYVGSTDSRGLARCLWEIVDNCVDEALAGYCTHIGVTMRADGSFEVADNGRG